MTPGTTPGTTPGQGATGLVSVIIPTYRRPEAVRSAVRSALAQTWSQVEVLVISDGPDPQTRVAVEGLDPRLRYLELPSNAGPAAARNAGVEASHGEWLTFLDDDDLMAPAKIEAQMRCAHSFEPRTMIACRAVYRRGNRQDIWPKREIHPDEDIADYLLLRPSLLGRPGVVLLQTLLVHRSILKTVPFTHRRDPEKHGDHEDWAWLLEAWHLAGARVKFAWEPLVIYNVDTETASRSRRTNWHDSLRWAQLYREWIGDRAFCSFLCTKTALKAKRARDWRGFLQIASAAVSAKPGLLDLLFLAGIALLPNAMLQTAWKRSLGSGNGSSRFGHGSAREHHGSTATASPS